MSMVFQLLRSTFTEYDLAKFPANMSELKAAPPHAWTHEIEHIVSRSMSFSEYEMSSHPIVLLTVVSTTDYDVVACMQEISSHHHTPQCLMTVSASYLNCHCFVMRSCTFSTSLIYLPHILLRGCTDHRVNMKVMYIVCICWCMTHMRPGPLSTLWFTIVRYAIRR